MPAIDTQVRRLSICALLVAGAANAAAPIATKVDGDPAVIAAIDAAVTSIDRDTSRYRHTEHELLDYSAEGGTLTALYDGSGLRKLSAHLNGESGNLDQQMYYSAGQLVFLDSVYEQYETKSRVEYRVYFSAGQPIHRIRAQSRNEPTEEIAMWDPVPELLGRVQRFVMCAAASTATCTAMTR